MKLLRNSMLDSLGKKLASPLSHLFANALTANFTRLFEAYCCILLGKGGGAGWVLENEVNAIKSLIRTSKPVLFDVGANKGEWSSFFNQAFPNSMIYLFEPQPGCQQIIKDKNLPNSTLFPNAVGAKKDTVRLYTVGETSGIASLHERKDSYSENKVFTSYDVEQITLDSVIEAYAISSIDFVKMDIEGHELDALKGAEKSLKKGVIKALLFEFGSANINSRTFFYDYWELLRSHGYKLYRILPSSRLLPIKEYYEDCEYFRGVTNYVAVLEETDT